MLTPIALLLLVSSPAMAAAEANKPHVRIMPSIKNVPTPPYPDAEREAGHNGRVTLFGIVGVDGRYQEVVVQTSSGSPVLDALALGAVRQATFRPARDEHDEPVAVPGATSISFGAYRFEQSRAGLKGYDCRQFVRDMDWWRGTHPDDRWTQHPLYKLVETIDATATLFTRNGMSVASIANATAGLDAHWNETIEKCRADPAALMVDTLRPEGKKLKAMSRQALRGLL